MDQPRISAILSTQQSKISQKRGLFQPEYEDEEEPFPVKNLAKNFENSVGFSETNYTFSKCISLNWEKDYPEKPQELQQDQYLSFNNELRTAKLGNQNDSKLSKYKHLLPSHLTTKFHANYEQLLNIAHQVDALLEKRSLLKHMESFENIKNELCHRLALQIEFSFLNCINSLVKDSYKFYRDPLGNVVVGFPLNFSCLKTRKFNLRKQLYAFICKNSEEMAQIKTIFIDIQESQCHIGKVQMFFPTSNKKYQTKQISRLSEAFLAKLKADVQRDEEYMMNFIEEDAESNAGYEIEWFVDKIQEIYRAHKVGHIYRANILKKFRKQGLPTKQTLRYLEAIEDTGYFLHRKNVPNKAPIYELKHHQKPQLLKRITRS